ncbi:hypothetical protein OUY22_36160 [Nonomuraea sp. MCN248]|uniref:ABC transporter permease n=1 Tax=Nonomuraea corallina TaxID=2989783 RepID=A0ABT4SNR0_9ACTN|nr:hypothetical protein [Nonomuraea corallina]MDA0638877.1 hypothetical protein [Nonomuraea corallina]
MRIGTVTGLGVMFATVEGESFGISPVWPVIGWFCGMAAAETLAARRGGRLGRPLRVRLAPTLTRALWVFAAMVSGAIALASVSRSFQAEVALAERGWAVFTLTVILAVNLLVMGLHRRPLRAEAADLVAAELAMRSRSARLLLAGGTIVVIWSAPGGGWSSGLDAFRSLLGVAVTLTAWGLALTAQPVTPANRPTPWRAVTAVLLTPFLAVGWNAAAAAEPDEQPKSPLTAPHGNAALFAYVTSGSGPWQIATMPDGREPDDEWDESTWDFGGFSLDRAVTRLATGDGGRRTGPLTLSGDGHHVVYLDSVTDRLVVQHLPEATRRDLTGPLPAHAVPEPHLSRDGRLAALVSSTGTELIDTTTGARTALPEVRRVLGLGPYGVIGTTGHRALSGAPDTELLTVDLGGRVRSRAPFDPTLPALATQDGRCLITLTGDEVVTMDARTARVTDRAALRLPRHHNPPEPLGWSAEGGLAVAIEPQGDDGHYHVLDPGTGESSPMKGVLDRLDHGVFGLIP